MKKLKKIWQENKVLMVLAIILIMCLIIFGVVAITYFYGTSDSVYGDRLSDTKEVPLKDDFIKNVEDEIKKEEVVNNSKVTVKGKIVYISITLNKDIKMDDAKKIAEKVPELFSEEELKVYELEFTIKNEDYTLMGSKNPSGSGFVWNNYNIKESSAE